MSKISQLSPWAAGVLLFSAVSFPLTAKDESTTQWMDLVKGSSTEGWIQRGGKARYDVVDGVVTGTSVANTPNSFLCTKKHYGDFILEYEFKIDEALNSGVQIRSNSLPDYRNGRVHGYQVEIDPDMKRARLWTAGIYDEGRRGWLNDLKDNEAARKAFKPGEWNHIKVSAIGSRIRTWLNGVPAADLYDSMTQEGFIGLQVHGVGGDETKVGKQVSWRKIRIKDLGKHVWKPIFDGKSFQGWEKLPGGDWKIKDGGIIHGTSPASERIHGMLLSKKSFKDFTVRLQFKVTKGDSGFYFRSERVKSGVALNGFQAEVDTSLETGGLYETGGRGWVVKPVNKKAYKPGQWSELSVHAHGTRVVVQVNGRKTAELPDDKKGRREGHFGLQLHGGQDMDVEYKKLEILVPAGGQG